MNKDDVPSFVLKAIARYEAGAASFPRFVLELESAVDLAEECNHPKFVELQRIWGQLEILNALALNGEFALAEKRTEIAALLDRFRSVVADRG